MDGDTSFPPTRVKTLSYCRLLQQRLQKYRWVGAFRVKADGPMHKQRWKGAFCIGEVIIGISDWEDTEDMAKEVAAQSSLGWLDQHGYH
jgi:hypothetical protein